MHPYRVQIPSPRKKPQSLSGKLCASNVSHPLLKYEINEVEFNFRVYKFVMCSSFLLPFYMAGWGWQTCFVRRAAFEFWFNEALTPSHVPPLISTSGDEKEMPLLLEVFTTGNVPLFCFSGGQALGNFPKLDLWMSCQQRAHCPSAMTQSIFLFIQGWLLPLLGWIELREDEKWALMKRGNEDYLKGGNQIKSFQIWINDF